LCWHKGDRTDSRFCAVVAFCGNDSVSVDYWVGYKFPLHLSNT
jgi:hypothetical protein